MHQQVEVVGLGDLAEFVAAARADQLAEARPALPFAIGLGDTLPKRLIDVLAPLVFCLLCAQFGDLLFAGADQRSEFGQCLVEGVGVQVAIGLRLVLGQALFALLQQYAGLLDGFFAVLQLLTQFAHLCVVVTEQLLQLVVIKFAVQRAPFAEPGAQVGVFLLQGLQALLAGFELGGQLQQLVGGDLQGLPGLGLDRAGLFDSLLQGLLPLFGAAVVTQQRLEAVLAGLLLGLQFADAALQGVQFLAAIGLLILLALDAAGPLRLLRLFVALLIELGQSLSHLLVEAYKAGGCVVAQGIEGGRWQQAGKFAQLVLKALAVGIEV